MIAGTVDLLLAKAADGCHARAIIENPDGQLEPLVGIDGVEIHASPGGENYGLYRADEQMLLALRRIGALTEPPPVILSPAPHQRRIVRSARRRVRRTLGTDDTARHP